MSNKQIALDFPYLNALLSQRGSSLDKLVGELEARHRNGLSTGVSIDTVRRAFVQKLPISHSSLVKLAAHIKAEPDRMRLNADDSDRPEPVFPHRALAERLAHRFQILNTPAEFLAPPGFHVYETFEGLSASLLRKGLGVRHLVLNAMDLGSDDDPERFWAGALAEAGRIHGLPGGPAPQGQAYQALRSALAPDPIKPERVQPVLVELDRFVSALDQDSTKAEATHRFLKDVLRLSRCTLFFGTVSLRVWAEPRFPAGSGVCVHTETFPLCEDKSWKAWTAALVNDAPVKPPPALVDRLKDRSGKHPMAFLRGLSYIASPNPDPDGMNQAVRQVHKYHAEDVLKFLPGRWGKALKSRAWEDPDGEFRDVLPGLAESRLLREDRGLYEPAVPAWAEYWGDPQ